MSGVCGGRSFPSISHTVVASSKTFHATVGVSSLYRQAILPARARILKSGTTDYGYHQVLPVTEYLLIATSWPDALQINKWVFGVSVM